MSDLQQQVLEARIMQLMLENVRLESHLQRMGENGKVVVTPYFGFYRIEYGINTEIKQKITFCLQINL